MDYLNNIAALIEEVAGSEYAEKVYQGIDLLADATPYAGTIKALTSVARYLASEDVERKEKVAAILKEAQVKAQAIADSY